MNQVQNLGLDTKYEEDPRPDCDEVGEKPLANGGDGTCKYYTGERVTSDTG